MVRRKFCMNSQKKSLWSVSIWLKYTYIVDVISDNSMESNISEKFILCLITYRAMSGYIKSFFQKAEMCTLSSLYLFSGKRIVRLHEPDFFVSALPLLSQAERTTYEKSYQTQLQWRRN